MTDKLLAPLTNEPGSAANERGAWQRKAWTAPLVIYASRSSGAAKTASDTTEVHAPNSSHYSS